MEIFDAFLKFSHILAVVFMAAPLYSLILVNERALYSPQMVYQVDRYMETLIGKNAVRCFVFQLTALVTGALLVWRMGWSWNTVLVLKLILLFSLMALLSFVHLGVQPRIEQLLAQVKNDPVAEKIVSRIKPLRLLRKRLAATCLFLMVATVLLGLQVYDSFPLVVNLAFLILVGFFCIRAFNKPLRLGWW
ncbi:MAG: hypothetical protein COT00_00705 [Candidatus Omnitrophica bacterium CG07_land_8_20_14_0_80_50_8]|nr:MAG: hypothetical protein COT00_00705 [Candidatus Omnitrophica bacterium CG07_land_8_20_14_0_80_50_8]